MHQFELEQKGLFTFYREECELQQTCSFGKSSKQSPKHSLSVEIDSYGIPSRLYPPQSMLSKSIDRAPFKPVIQLPSNPIKSSPKMDINKPQRNSSVKMKRKKATVAEEKIVSNREMEKIIEKMGNRVMNSDISVSKGYFREKHNSKKFNLCRITPMEPVEFKTILPKNTDNLPTNHPKIAPSLQRRKRSKQKTNLHSEIKVQTSERAQRNEFFCLPSIRKSIKSITNLQFNLSGEKKPLKQSPNAYHQHHHRSIQQIVSELPQQAFKSEIMDTIAKAPLVKNHLNFKYLERSKEGSVVEVESERDGKFLQILRQFQVS